MQRRAAREHLGSLYAALGLYERAISIDRARLGSDPGRLVWSLLHAGHFDEAREVSERMATRRDGERDRRSQMLLAAAGAAASSEEKVAARVAVLPLFSAAQARQVLAGFREPAPRLPAR